MNSRSAASSVSFEIVVGSLIRAIGSASSVPRIDDVAELRAPAARYCATTALIARTTAFAASVLHGDASHAAYAAAHGGVPVDLEQRARDLGPAEQRLRLRPHRVGGGLPVEAVEPLAVQQEDRLRAGRQRGGEDALRAGAVRERARGARRQRRPAASS